MKYSSYVIKVLMLCSIILFTSVNGRLIIDSNDKLADFCAISFLVSSSKVTNNRYDVKRNGYNPGYYIMEFGNCKKPFW